MPTLLARPEMVRACRGRDFGAIFAMVRSVGVTASSMARDCGLSPNRVSDVIHGRHMVEKIDVVERIADGLRIPGHMLGLADRPWEDTAKHRHSTPPVRLTWTADELHEMVGSYTGSDLVMDRRSATRTIMSVTLGPALLDSLERWLVNESPPRPGTRRPSGVGDEEVKQLEHTARVFRQWDHQFGGGLRRKAVVGQLSEVAGLLRGAHPHSIERRLYRVMAELAGTAATMSWDCGMQKVAHDYYLIAVQAAKAAGDRALGANVLAGMARQYLYLDRPQDALDIIRLARDGAHSHATPAVVSMLLTREAWAYAQLGRVEAFRRATALAEDRLTDSTRAEEPHWIGYFGRAEIAGVTGGRWLDLARVDRRHAEAARVNISAALAMRTTGSLRSRALDHLGLAEVHFILGDHSTAVRVANRALDVAEHTRSGRVSTQIRDLYGRTAARGSQPGVRELRSRMRDLLAA